jgi:ribonucleotide monophosphatase NagD (HAD superfamily)
MKKKIYLVDIDKTVTTQNLGGVIIPQARDKLVKFAKKSHKIIYITARSKRLYVITTNMLKKNGFPSPYSVVFRSSTSEKISDYKKREILAQLRPKILKEEKIKEAVIIDNNLKNIKMARTLRKKVTIPLHIHLIKSPKSWYHIK